MFARPSRGRGYNNYRGSTRKSQATRTAKGLFADNVWHCDCKPRLPAERFQVKKEGKNKGKWFYTCQQESDKRCGFFIFADEAQRREASALLNNSRTELRHENTPRTGSSRSVTMTPGSDRRIDAAYAADDSTESEPEPSPSRRKADSRQIGTKRTAHMAGFDQDEQFGGDFNAAETEALVTRAESLQPETPVKGMRETAYATPATTAKKRKLPWSPASEAPVPAQPALKFRVDELLTPAKTPHSKDKTIEEASTPVRAPVGANELAGAGATSPMAAATTPDRPLPAEPGRRSPPQRYYDALADPDDSNSPLVASVFAELSSLHIPAEAAEKVRSILSQHELKTQGIQKGRDITRLALQSKTETVTTMQRRIQSLENDLALQRALHSSNRATSLRR